MMVMGYAKHPSMSIFILDPQGEFAGDLARLLLCEEYWLRG